MHEITRYRGDTHPDTVLLISRATGRPLNLTGYSAFRLSVDTRADPVDATTLQYSVDGELVQPATAGTLRFSPTLSNANRVGQFFFDVELVDGAGLTRTAGKGRYVYLQDIGKA